MLFRCPSLRKTEKVAETTIERKCGEIGWPANKQIHVVDVEASGSEGRISPPRDHYLI